MARRVADRPERIPRTEQGLLFWLFSYLVEDEDSEWRRRRAFRRLREAARRSRRVPVTERFVAALILQHGPAGRLTVV